MEKASPKKKSITNVCTKKPILYFNNLLISCLKYLLINKIQNWNKNKNIKKSPKDGLIDVLKRLGLNNLIEYKNPGNLKYKNNYLK